MDKQTIEKILDAAIKAPSGDNVQPWKFEVSEDYSRVDLYNLPERDDSYYNYEQVAAYIAHGAVIENIAIAARHLGFKAEINLFPDQEAPNHVAIVKFESALPDYDPLYEAIFSRSTNRFHYQSWRLPDEDRQKLIDSVKQVENVTGYFVHNPKIIKKLARVLMVNDRIVFELKDIHGFLFDKIRWSQQQIDETKDGMPVDTLGLNGFEKLFFPLMRYWWFVKTANIFGLSRVIGGKCWYNCLNAAIIGQLTIKQADRYGFIQAGRAMQRVWLEATRQGLAFQPIVGLPLLMYRAKANALQAFSDKHRQAVETAESSLREIFQIDQSEQLIVGFRIGKGTNVSAKTPRKPVLKI